MAMRDLTLNLMNELQSVILARHPQLSLAEAEEYRSEVIRRLILHIREGDEQAYVRTNGDGSMEVYVYWTEVILDEMDANGDEDE